jgi:hypothetical protein
MAAALMLVDICSVCPDVVVLRLRQRLYPGGQAAMLLLCELAICSLVQCHYDL